MTRAKSPALQRWDERHARTGDQLASPLPILAQAIALAAHGRALDVACGLGRHTLPLAQHGYDVVAVDGSSVALDRLQARAASLGVSARIRTVLADLEQEPPEFVPEPNQYALAAVFCFLHRPLFPHLAAGLAPRGVLVASTHVAAPGARRRSFALEPLELSHIVMQLNLRIVHYDERPAESAASDAMAELIAVKDPSA